MRLPHCLSFLNVSMNYSGTPLNEMTEKRQSLWMYAAFLATILLSVLPFFRVGFTTSDDAQYFVTAQQSWQYWLMDHQVYAQHQGRFYLLVTKFFYYIPYLADNFFVTKVIQYVSLMACYALFAYLVYRIMHSRMLALLVMLLMVFNTCIAQMNYFIPVTAYPFYFSFSFMVFLCGILMFVNYYQNAGEHSVRSRRLNPVWGSLLFFVAALFYENFLVFMLLFGIYVFLRHWRRDGFGRLWCNASFYRELVPVVVAMVIYVAVYVGYRRWLSATMPELAFYSGALLSGENGFSWRSFFRLVSNCTLVTLPGQTYFQSRALVAGNSLALSGMRNSPLFILTHASAVVIVNALLQAGLFLFIVRRLQSRGWSWKRLLAVAVAALVFAFSANMLIAVTVKYQEWSHWLKGYVTSFYSYFGMALALALLVVATLKWADGGRWIRWVRGAWTFLVFFFAVVIGFSNEHLSREWQRSQNRWVVIDQMADAGYFGTLPDDALLCTEGLHRLSPTSYAICEGTYDIENYITLRSGRKFSYAIDSAGLEAQLLEHPDAPRYTFSALESKKTNELLVTVSDDKGATCFYLSPAKSFSLFYKDGDAWQRKAVVSGHPRRKATEVRLEGAALDPASFYVSTMIDNKDNQ